MQKPTLHRTYNININGDNSTITQEYTTLNGLKEGLYKEWYDNGQKLNQVKYIAGKPYGLYREWHKNGKKKFEVTYIDGNYNGTCKEWYDNGQIARKCIYYDGKKQGIFKEWHKNGTLKIKTNYICGKLNGLYEQWYDNGQKAQESNHINDIVYGLYQAWYKNSQIHIKYPDGLRFKVHKRVNGLYQRWYENGKKMEEHFVDENKDGIRLLWKEDGDLYEFAAYRSGIEIDLKHYVRDLTAKYKEELMAAVFHPDRLDRFAAKAGMETMDYMDLVLPL